MRMDCSSSFGGSTGLDAPSKTYGCPSAADSGSPTVHIVSTVRRTEDNTSARHDCQRHRGIIGVKVDVVHQIDLHGGTRV